jgi:hypothetical protein
MVSSTAWASSSKGDVAPANRVVAEVKRWPRPNGLLPYMRATFHLMDLARDLLEPEVCRSGSR